MREKSLHVLASLSLALGLLLAGSALAQEKSNPPAKADQPSAKPNSEKPANPPAKDSEQPKSEQPSKPAQKQADKPAEKPKDNATEKAPDRTSPRNTDRSDRDRSDRQPDASRTDRNNTDRSNTDRSNTDRSKGDRSSTDRKGTDTAKRGNKDVKASDLGFTFDESDNEKGLKLSKLASKSIGSKADFKEGDIIVSINDHRVRSQKDFVHWIHAGSHDRITVIVLRDDREVTLYLDPAVIFEETTVHTGAWLGVDLNDRFATAAVVLKVHPNSPAQRAGLKGEDVILSVDGQRIQSADHLGEVIGRLEPEQKVEIRIERNQQAEVVDATLGRRENVSRRTSVLPRR